MSRDESTKLQAEIMEAQQVALLFGDSSDCPTRYTRANIRCWLLNWGNLFESELADTSLSWVMVKADVEQVIAKQPRYLRKYFRLACVRGLSDQEIAEASKVSLDRVSRLWRELSKRVCDALLSRQMRTLPAKPARYGGRDSSTCYWWEAVGERSC